MYSFHAKKAVCHSRAGVTACCHKYVYGFFPVVFYKMSKKACHEACAHILEGQCRPMIELERIDVFRNLYHGTVERKRVVHDCLQGITFYVFAEKGVGNDIRNLLERHVPDVIKETFGQSLDLFRHEKPFVVGKSFHNSLAE